MTLPLITARVRTDHPVEPGALLIDLGIDPVDVLGLCDDIERGHGIELPSAEVEGWITVADVLASVAGRVG
jgi:acyl carrier protein